MWQPIKEFPDGIWVFVYFEDGIEYGLSEDGELNIGGTTFCVRDAMAWCEAPEPNELL